LKKSYRYLFVTLFSVILFTTPILASHDSTTHIDGAVIINNHDNILSKLIVLEHRVSGIEFASLVTIEKELQDIKRKLDLILQALDIEDPEDPR